MATTEPILSQLLERLHAWPLPAGGPRIVCIDGPAGSGKTTLAAQLAAPLGAPTVHMDDLYDGWTGVEKGADILVADILTPLAAGKPAHYRRYDWVLGEYAERHHVEDVGWLVVEGCASATTIVDNFGPFIIWVETDSHTRLARGLERDGQDMEENWRAFMELEMVLYEHNRTRERAHVRLDGYGQIVSERD
ncbi:uridine kinase family protein [Timonella senegalensis]|uniref:uridine kinase family protein n=2 Tax=Timonella senegalensis TaxID=1465825 RepID=UPI000314C1F0|nr:(d)CMP kinase [Timonella senegalensis]